MIVKLRGAISTLEDLRWHILYTTPQGERLAKEDLCDLGLLPFVPVQKVWHRPARHRGKRGKELVERPLFPRYMFLGLRHGVDEADTALRSKRVLQILSDARGRPLLISPHEVVGMMKEVERGAYDAAVIRAAKLAQLLGKHVDILDGPFQGLCGTIVKVSKKVACVELPCFGRTVDMQIPLAELDNTGLYSVQDDQQKQSAPPVGVG